MSVQKLRNIAIYCGSIDIFNWLNCTLKLTSLTIENIYGCGKVNELSDIELSLVIVTEDKFKSLLNYLNNTNKSFPILVITNDFSGFIPSKQRKITIDTVPLPAITIAIRS